MKSTLEVEEGSDMMLLDALILFEEQDQQFHSVAHAVKIVCGSDGLNMNGKKTDWRVLRHCLALSGQEIKIVVATSRFACCAR